MSNERHIRSFEDLEAWKACRALRVFVAKSVVPDLPKNEEFRLKDQLLRSARSTTANIAEGYGRFHFRDNLKFVRIARGEAYEVVDHLISGNDESLVSEELLEKGRELAETAIRILNGYARYLENAATKSQ